MRQSWDSLEFEKFMWRCPLGYKQPDSLCSLPNNELCVTCWKKQLDLDSLAKELRKAKIKANDTVKILPIIILT